MVSVRFAEMGRNIFCSGETLVLQFEQAFSSHDFNAILSPSFNNPKDPSIEHTKGEVPGAQKKIGNRVLMMGRVRNSPCIELRCSSIRAFRSLFQRIWRRHCESCRVADSTQLCSVTHSR